MDDFIEIFKSGAALCVWRNSSPSNYWLEIITESGSCDQTHLDVEDFLKIVRMANHKVESDKEVYVGRYKPMMESHFFNEPTKEQIERVLSA